MKRAGILILALALGWVATWLSLGLLNGRATMLLHPGNPDWLKNTYLGILYGWLLLATSQCWKRWGPPRPSLSWGSFFGFLGLGLALMVCQRGVLWLGGWWTPPPGLNLSLLLIAFMTSPLLAVAEELVFRGYLYGVVREELGELPALVGVNAFFALIHLFRPGSLVFKLAWGFGLWLAGVVLTLVYRRTGKLSAAMGLHSSWIIFGVVDPPGRAVSGWLPGLAGDPAAGLVGWLFLLGLAVAVGAKRAPA